MDALRLSTLRLSAVEPEVIRFCFDAVTHGSIAEGARLEIIETPGGSAFLQVISGDRMRVKDLEVE